MAGCARELHDRVVLGAGGAVVLLVSLEIASAKGPITNRVHLVVAGLMAFTIVALLGWARGALGNTPVTILVRGALIALPLHAILTRGLASWTTKIPEAFTERLLKNLGTVGWCARTLKDWADWVFDLVVGFTPGDALAQGLVVGSCLLVWLAACLVLTWRSVVGVVLLAGLLVVGIGLTWTVDPWNVVALCAGLSGAAMVLGRPRHGEAEFRAMIICSMASALVLLVASGLYCLSPIDFLPEAVLGPFGYAEDAMLLGVASKRCYDTFKRAAIDWNGTRAA
jgi:hypothetical protein